jgi:hypothetical protein
MIVNTVIGGMRQPLFALLTRIDNPLFLRRIVGAAPRGSKSPRKLPAQSQAPAHRRGDDSRTALPRRPWFPEWSTS